MHSLRLGHSALGFWIGVRVRQFNGRWLAVADLAGEPDLGTGDTARQALWAALSSFRITLRADLVAEAERQPGLSTVEAVEHLLRADQAVSSADADALIESLPGALRATQGAGSALISRRPAPSRALRQPRCAPVTRCAPVVLW